MKLLEIIEQYLENQPKWKLLHKFRNVEYLAYIDTKGIHALDRMHERRPDLTPENWSRFWREIYYYIWGEGKNKGHDSGLYNFYFNRDKQCIVTRVEKKRREVRIITILPKGKKETSQQEKNKNTVFVLLENIYSTKYVEFE